MKEYGVTKDGYVRKRQLEIISSLEEKAIAAFGQVNLEPDSVWSQLIGIFSTEAAEIWQSTENVYNSQYVATSEGVALDNVGALIGVIRNAPTYTKVSAGVGGVEGTFIPPGSQARIDQTQNIFTINEPVTISRYNAITANLSINELVPNVNYTIIINNIPFTVNSGNVPNAINIISLLALEINNDADNDFCEAIDNLDGTLTINSIDFAINISIDPDSKFTINDFLSGSNWTSNEFGVIFAPQNTLNIINTPVAGWNKINNLIPGVTGTNLESDIDYRIRINQSVRLLAAATPESIIARILQEVDSVSRVIIFENRTNLTDSEGRPPHSFETLVLGGNDQEIANKLWEVKPAGIETFGNITKVVIDSSGFSQIVSFSRPGIIKIWVKIQVNVVSGAFPSEGITAIAENVRDYGNKLDVGSDVIWQKFFEPVYKVPGIIYANISFATGDNPNPSDYVEDNIIINAGDVAIFDLARINVEII